MEILLKFWPIAAALGWLLLIWIGVGFYVCRKYTGTWNGLRYIFDHRYWCFAILNHEYLESLKNNDDIDMLKRKGNFWILDADICNYAGACRFYVGLAKEIKVIDSPEFEEYVYNYVSTSLVRK